MMGVLALSPAQGGVLKVRLLDLGFTLPRACLVYEEFIL